MQWVPEQKKAFKDLKLYLQHLPTILSLEEPFVSRYRLYGSLAVLPLEEPFISRLLGRNWRPTVPGVQDPNKYFTKWVEVKLHNH
jgi:hypothetical protein